MKRQIEMLKQAAAVIVMTRREGDALAACGVAPSNIHHISAGIEPALLSEGDGERFRAQHNLHVPIIAYIGTAAFDKGTVHLVEAMKEVWRTRDAVLVLAVVDPVVAAGAHAAERAIVVVERDRRAGEK